jgi:hypothetical protein
MAELDDQLRELATQRADAVPAFDPTAPRLRGHRSARHRAAVVTGIAACVVALLVAGGFAVFRGSDDSPSVRTPAGSTDAPTPTGPTCPPLSGASGEAKDGPSVPGAPPNPQDHGAGIGVQASDCTDDVVFSFGQRTPRWSIRYQPGPLTADEPPNSTWYVIRFPGLPPNALGDNGDEVRAIAPSGVTAVKRITQPDGVEAWAIGLAQQRPFRIVAGRGVLRVQFVLESPHVRTCSNSYHHFAYDVPPGWFVEVTASGSACSFLAPQPFSMCGGNCEDPIDYGGIAVSTADSGGSFGGGTVLRSSEATVAGRSATVRELELTRAGIYPAGARAYEYSVDWAPDGVLDIWNGGLPGPDFDARKAGLDAIAATVRRIE